MGTELAFREVGFRRFSDAADGFGWAAFVPDFGVAPAVRGSLQEAPMQALPVSHKYACLVVPRITAAFFVIARIARVAVETNFGKFESMRAEHLLEEFFRTQAKLGD